MASNFKDILAKKLKGSTLTKDEIQIFIDGVTEKTMEDCQIGAMLAAIFINGMDTAETGHLTRSMKDSGSVLSWPAEWKGRIVDKHSTGGVGDKISLALAPALAAWGLKVPMISGRGLMHTGGTLDKLEAIPGYTVKQTTKSMEHILDTVGCCIVGQTEELVPADSKLYATRDVTNTVDNLPLITGSIISKKGAETLDALVLDVKFGRAAVIQDKDRSRELAKQMANAGRDIQIEVRALQTKMDCPIGKKVGNALEIWETIEILNGGGPKTTRELVEQEGGHLLSMVKVASSPEEGAEKIREVLNNGKAMAKFCAMIKALGVSDKHADMLCAKDADVFAVLDKAKCTKDLESPESGYVADIDALVCGKISYNLGAGRTRSADPVDHAVGLVLHVEVGDVIEKGKPWITVHHNKDLSTATINELQAALKISPDPLKDVNLSLVQEVIYPD